MVLRRLNARVSDAAEGASDGGHGPLSAAAAAGPGCQDSACQATCNSSSSRSPCKQLPKPCSPCCLHLSIKITLQTKLSYENDIEEKDAQSDYGVEQFTRAEKPRVLCDKGTAEGKVITEKDGHDGRGKAEEPDDGGKCANAEPDAADVANKKQQVLYGKPVSWCKKSRRWRDKHGRYCRPPSPARPLAV
jgi:hypothetical protein